MMSTCQFGILSPVASANDIFRAITRAIKNKARPNDFADYQSLEKIVPFGSVTSHAAHCRRR